MTHIRQWSVEGRRVPSSKRERAGYDRRGVSRVSHNKSSELPQSNLPIDEHARGAADAHQSVLGLGCSQRTHNKKAFAVADAFAFLTDLFNALI